MGLYVENPTCLLPSNDKFVIQNKEISCISEGQKDIWKRVIASLFFTLSIFYIFIFAVYIYFLSIDNLVFLEKQIPPLFVYLMLRLFIPVITITFFTKAQVNVVQIEFDTHHSCFREIHNYGWFKRKKKWKCIPIIEYISLYYQERDSGYEVSLWSENNKALELFKGNNLGETFRLAHEVAQLFEVDLYNATDFHDSYWVDMTLSKEELFQELIKRNK